MFLWKAKPFVLILDLLIGVLYCLAGINHIDGESFTVSSFGFLSSDSTT
jgi:hypothetical protein